MIPTLPSGGSVTFLVQATVTAASGTVSNTASIATPLGTNDPNSGNNQVSDSDTVQPNNPPPVVAQNIPTLSGWALIALVLALGWAGARARRRF